MGNAVPMAPPVSDEIVHELAEPLRRSARVIEHRSQLTRVLIEILCYLKKAAVLRKKVVKVQRLLLSAAKFVGDDGKHRLAQDRRLHHCAGIDADNRRAVIERV